ncbi:hypothetical protein VPH35_079190 [Triticum aestivum]
MHTRTTSSSPPWSLPSRRCTPYMFPRVPRTRASSLRAPLPTPSAPWPPRPPPPPAPPPPLPLPLPPPPPVATKSSSYIYIYIQILGGVWFAVFHPASDYNVTSYRYPCLVFLSLYPSV